MNGGRTEARALTDARDASVGVGVVDVVVVGAGVAGTAAALAAARAGARVTLIDGGTGASTLATGALDEARVAGVEPAPASAEARAAMASLDAYALPERGATLLTTAGAIRRASGHDAGLIDASAWTRSNAEAAVGVVRSHRPGWDADALAYAWGDAFVAIDATIVRHADERSLPDADFAARHDDEARLGWMAERLREAMARSGKRLAALVVPPSLGVERARAAALSSGAGVPCGEAVGLPGGPCGLRFEASRDRALALAGIGRVTARATAVRSRGAGWTVVLESDVAIDASSVVLATGGLLGGGIAYAPSESMLVSTLPPHARPPLRFTIDAPITLGVAGRALELPGSLFGLPAEQIAWPHVRGGRALLQTAGAIVDHASGCAAGAARLYAAGELTADAPRTWLAALTSGARAGAGAAEDAVSASERRRPDGAAASPARASPASSGAAPASRP